MSILRLQHVSRVAENCHCRLFMSPNSLKNWTDTFVPGSYSDYPVKQNFAMAPMQLSPMALQQQQPPHPHHHHVNDSAHGSIHGNGQVLDYLENQVRGLDVGPPQMARHGGQNMPLLQPQLQPQPAPVAVPYTPGPPSMLSALGELGVRGVERRVITLPPIIQRVPSFSSRRGLGGGDGARGGPILSSQSSGSTNRSGGGLPRNSRGYRDVSPPRRGILRDYSDESDWENKRGRAPHRDSRNERGGSARRRGGGSRPRTRSRDDLMEELHSRAARRDRSYSPPQRRKGSWSSDEDEGSRRKGGKGKDWLEKPPSYFSIENQRGHSNSRRNYNHLSVRPTPKYWHTLWTNGLMTFIIMFIYYSLFISSFFHHFLVMLAASWDGKVSVSSLLWSRL